MCTDHVVRAYDEELKRLDRAIEEMGTLAITQIEAAMRVLTGQDKDLAQVVCDRDRKIDGLERDVDDFTVRLLALRQPMADDLRKIISALRISIDLERIADYAVSVAKRGMDLRNHIPSKAIVDLEEMGRTLVEMLRDSLRAYRSRNTDLAREVWERDDLIDRSYIVLLNQLRTRMVEDPLSVQSGSHLLFVCKNLERIGDHLTNICEHIHYLVKGVPLERPWRAARVAG